jgi:protein-S-isoprenylcysteine O-methyltransferase Ste14
MTPEMGVYSVWIAWAVSWIAASIWSGRTVKRPAAGSQLAYRALTLLGFVLMFGFVAVAPASHQTRLLDVPGPLAFTARLWTVSDGLGWAMAGVAALGFAFAWWARLYLGRLWSGFVTRKEGHRIVDTGPYALVRHPIYTGIDVASIALVVVKASPIAIAGAILVIAGYWLKARIEERWLRQELGAADYDAYARRVPMLVPFSPL